MANPALREGSARAEQAEPGWVTGTKFVSCIIAVARFALNTCNWYLVARSTLQGLVGFLMYTYNRCLFLNEGNGKWEKGRKTFERSTFVYLFDGYSFHCRLSKPILLYLDEKNTCFNFFIDSGWVNMQTLSPISKELFPAEFSRFSIWVE